MRADLARRQIRVPPPFRSALQTFAVTWTRSFGASAPRLSAPCRRIRVFASTMTVAVPAALNVAAVLVRPLHRPSRTTCRRPAGSTSARERRHSSMTVDGRLALGTGSRRLRAFVAGMVARDRRRDGDERGDEDENENLSTAFVCTSVWGRGFTQLDGVLGTPPAAVLSANHWRRVRTLPGPKRACRARSAASSGSLAT